MHRVVHLVDCEELGCSGAGAIIGLRAHGRCDHRVVLIGVGEAIRRVQRWGLHGDEVVLTPASRWRTVGSRLRTEMGPETILHAWSIETAKVGCLVFPGRRMVLSLGWTPVVSRSATRSLRSHGTSLLCVTAPDEATSERLMSVGLSRVQTVVWPQTGMFGWGDREALRREIGIGEDEWVLLPMGEPTSEIDAKTVAYQAGVASVAGKKMVALIPERSRDIDRALRFTLLHEGVWRILVVGLEPLEMLACADLVLAQPQRRSGHDVRSILPAASHSVLRASVEAGIPVVAEDTPELRELIGSARVVFAAESSPLAMNRAIYQIMLDGTVAAAEGERAEGTPLQTAMSYAGEIEGLYSGAVTSATATLHGAPTGMS